VIETPQSLKDFVSREITAAEWFTVTQDTAFASWLNSLARVGRAPA
jgi:hypothetical protein